MMSVYFIKDTMDEEDVDNLSSWSLESYTESKMSIKLDFKDP